MPEEPTSFERSTIGDIAGLKRDAEIAQKLWDKLDNTIDKMMELVTTIGQGLKLHEQKFEYQEEKDRHLDKDIRALGDKVDALTQKLTALEASMTSVLQRLDTLFSEEKDDDKKGNTWKKQLDKVSKWVWMSLGGLAVLGWELGNTNIVKAMASWLNGDGPIPPIPHK